MLEVPLAQAASASADVATQAAIAATSRPRLGARGRRAGLENAHIRIRRVSAKGRGTAKCRMDSDLYRRGFAILAIGVLGVAAWRIFEPFFGALAWAACLAFLLTPAQAWLTRRLGGRAGLAAGTVTLLTPVVLLAPLAMLGVAFAAQVRALLAALQRSSFRIDATLIDHVEQWPLVGPAASWVRANVAITAGEFHEGLLAALQSSLRSLAAASGNIVVGAVGTVVGFFLMLFLLFFLLRDGGAMLERAVRLVPLEATRRSQLLGLIGNTTRAVVFGTVVTAVVQGALVGIAFAFAGLTSPVVFGVLAAVLALLPAGGSAIVWIPAVLYLATAGRWGWAIFMLAWGAGVSISDNLLRPVLISNIAPVSTLAVFIGVVGGVSAFGAVGLIAGPVLLTLIVALLRFVDDPAGHEPPQPPAPAA
jgi:predicted PurR-regulated permease PerM